jgi:hypothetical protein
MAMRIRSRVLAASLPAGEPGDTLGPFAELVHRQNVNLSQLDIIAARSAELCVPGGFRAKHFGSISGQQGRNSGQRAASRCSTRLERVGGVPMGSGTSEEMPSDRPSRVAVSSFRARRSVPDNPHGRLPLPARLILFERFQPIRPGPNAEPSGYELRPWVAGKRQVILTAKGIGPSGGT